MTIPSQFLKATGGVGSDRSAPPPLLLAYGRLMLAVGYKLDVYSLKFEHRLGYWPVCQITFIDIWSGRHGHTRLPRRENPIIRKC